MTNGVCAKCCRTRLYSTFEGMLSILTSNDTFVVACDQACRGFAITLHLVCLTSQCTRELKLLDRGKIHQQFIPPKGVAQATSKHLQATPLTSAANREPVNLAYRIAEAQLLETVSGRS